jgi:hypothetical protein
MWDVERYVNVAVNIRHLQQRTNQQQTKTSFPPLGFNMGDRSSNSSSTTFCSGMGMSMGMYGFGGNKDMSGAFCHSAVDFCSLGF